MSERQLLPVSPFSDFQDPELPKDQAASKRLVENITNASVMPFEFEKGPVTADHFDMQRRIWGQRDDHLRPLELSINGREA